MSHAAYSAITHGLLSKWTYLSRVVLNMSHLLIPLDNTLQTKLIPAITGRPPPNSVECDFYALPARLGGLAITIPSKLADKELQYSLTVTSSLTDHILAQDNEYGYNIVRDHQLKKREVSKDNRNRQEEEAASMLPGWLQKAVELSKTKGASTWLTVLPLYRNMDSHYTSRPSKMPWHYAMAGPQLACPPNTTVAKTSMWSTPSLVPKEGFLR